ncbi:FBP domain-containing protein [Pseudalkalibacillus hwajinpoensis]|uniref:FBP domain-containing protein n=1 Tax=Guptibacillus hwajinpoensis TaxID=208199 RepID=UPI00325B7832
MLFPNSNKVKASDYDSLLLTYLGWNDVRSKRRYFVYPMDDTLVGVEGAYMIHTQPATCALCGCLGQVAHVTKKAVNQESDYHTLGNYMCVDNQQCNAQLTDPHALEQ